MITVSVVSVYKILNMNIDSSNLVDINIRTRINKDLYGIILLKIIAGLFSSIMSIKYLIIVTDNLFC